MNRTIQRLKLEASDGSKPSDAKCKKTTYSYRNDLTGLTVAALKVCKLTVPRATRKTNDPASTNIQISIRVR